MSPDRQIARIRLPRSAIPIALGLAAAAVWLAACSDPSAPPGLSVTAVDPTDGQIGVVGTELPLPLSVRIESDGEPRAGVTVSWEVSAGTILPAQTVSDAGGLASATWTLGPEIGTMTATTTVEGAAGSPVSFRATGRAPVVAAAPVSPTDGQTGAVGTELARPLRVEVRSEGVPRAGALVHWHAREGSVSPAASVTDADGIAAAGWTLGAVAGDQRVDVTVDQATSVVTGFTAHARPGPVAGIAVVGDTAETFPANHASWQPLGVRVQDQYGNGVPGQAVTWTVRQGPIGLASIDSMTDSEGLSTTVIDPTGEGGDAVVRAALSGTGLSVDFAITVAPASFDVRLSASGAHSFVSAQNGSSPAVDTIPAGRSVTWILDFDYDQHAIAPVGQPEFLRQEFPYANPSTVTVAFPTPGTYQYTDPYVPGSAGTVVVQ